jgi:hypothetical protein
MASENTIPELRPDDEALLRVEIEYLYRPPLFDEFTGNIGGDRRFTYSALLLDHGDYCHGCLLC